MNSNSIPQCNLRNGDSHSKIILWGWQLSEWHSDNQANPIDIYKAYIGAGITAIDCADIYTWVEASIGESLDTIYWSGHILPRIHTKHVPDLVAIENREITEEWTRSLILRSIQRTRRAYLDLVQFHQWNYEIDTYLISIKTLKDLEYEGLIHWIGVTNCSVEFLLKLEKECDFVPISSQSQYNVIDRRPEKKMLTHCRERNIAFYAYGSIMWWLLTGKLLWTPEPQEPIENRSLRKYLRIISDWWDWELFQELLYTLDIIAKSRNVKIGDIAIAWTIWKVGNGAVITGARNATHASDIQTPFSFTLSDEDLSQIDAVYLKWKPIEWDCFDLERYEPRHRDIMKFNLNTK